MPSKHPIKIYVCEPDITELEINAVTEAIKSKDISSIATPVHKLENAFAEKFGMKHAIAVNSGGSALFLALYALGIKSGDEVIVPDFTMIASAAAVSHCGATPVFVDSSEKSFNIDVTKIEEKITPRTKAIMPVHIYGEPCLPENTKVITQCGEVSIKEQRKLSRVLGLVNGNVEFVNVLNHSHRNASELIEIKLEGGIIIEATPGHPIFTQGNGWVPAGKLKIGDTTINTISQFHENLDKRTNKTSRENLSGSRNSGRDNKTLPSILLETNKRTSLLFRIKNKINSSFSKLAERIKNKETFGTREGLFSWFNRWGRDYSHELLQEKMVLSPSFNNQYKHEDYRFPEEYWTRNKYPIKKEVELESYLRYVNQRNEDSATTPHDRAILNRKEKTSILAHKILQEEGKLADRVQLWNGGLQYVQTNEKIKSRMVESVKRKFGEFEVYNIETESNNYFANGVLVHNCDMDAIMDIAKRHNLFVVEDAAEAHGAKYKNKLVGTFGIASCFSFYANKIMTTGEGGMILTNDSDLANRLEHMRGYDFNDEKHFWHQTIAWNLRMSALSAALGLAQLQRLDELIEKRLMNAKYYTERLKDIPGIRFFPGAPNTFSVSWMYSVVVPRCDELMEFLAKNGIETRTFFIPMHVQPVYNQTGDFKRADYYGTNGLYLPSSSNISKEDKDFVISKVKEFYSVK